MNNGTLLVFGGLPGTGKTTIAREAAKTLRAAYLRIDSLETALVRSGLVDDQWDIGPSGYYAAQAIALDNLKNGATVIADCVNPLLITRNAWRDVALAAKVPCLEIEVVCSDVAEHRRRVESRAADIEGHRLPAWKEVLNREYDPWDRDRLVIDTATNFPEQAVDVVVRAASSLRTV